MDSGEDREGLRHKPRHKSGDAEKALTDMRLFELKLMWWGVPREHPNVKSIRDRLEKVFRRLSFFDQRDLLEAAESIALAEDAKASWNPKTDGERQLELRGLAYRTMNLRNEIQVVLPAPLRREHSELLEKLGDFSADILFEMKPVAIANSQCEAASMVRRAKRRLVERTGFAHFELLADLAWLASGMRYQISERSVRRYQKIQFRSVPTSLPLRRVSAKSARVDPDAKQ